MLGHACSTTQPCLVAARQYDIWHGRLPELLLSRTFSVFCEAPRPEFKLAQRQYAVPQSATTGCITTNVFALPNEGGFRAVIWNYNGITYIRLRQESLGELSGRSMSRTRRTNGRTLIVILPVHEYLSHGMEGSQATFPSSKLTLTSLQNRHASSYGRARLGD